MPTTPPTVTVVLGEEELLAERAVNDAVAAATTALGAGTAVDRVSADALPDGFALDLATTSLFGGGRVVVVDRAQELDAKARASVLAAVKDPAPGMTLVLRATGVGRQTKFFNEVQRHGELVKVAKLKPAECGRWVKAEVRRLGRSADERALSTLVELVGTDLRELAGAVAKLHLAVPPPAQITAEDVNEHLTSTAERGVFEFTDAVLDGDTATALSHMDTLLGQGESEVRLMALLAGQVRRLVQVSDAPNVPPARLAKQLGLPEWQVKKAKRTASRYRPEQLRRSLTLVADADAELRTGAFPKPRLLLELLVTQLAKG